MKKKIIRITTVPISLGGLLKGQSRFMNQYYEVVGISSSGPMLDRVVINEGIRVIPVEMTRKITPFKDLKALWQLYFILRKEKPFIVHSHTPKAGTLGMLAAKMAGVEHRLHTIAGLPLLVAKGPKRTLLNLVEKITYACATKIYPNSHAMKKIILDLKFCNEDKLKVIGNGSSNGIDTNHFDPSLYTQKEKDDLKFKLGIGKEDIVFIYLGRFVSDKGINELITAFQEVYKQYPKAKLLMVGTFEKHLDPLKPETIEVIKTHPAIIQLEWQQDVRLYLYISDCLAFPSYREGFPNVVMQAGAMGLYCIVTDINGCNEIIIEGKNGTLIPVRNSSLLEQKMKLFLDGDLADNKDVRRNLIVNRYEQSFIWSKLLEEYNEILYLSD